MFICVVCFFFCFFFFLMIRRPPRSTRVRSSAASDVYKRQTLPTPKPWPRCRPCDKRSLSLIHISEPTRLLSISYAVFCLKKKNITVSSKKKKKKKIKKKIYYLNNKTKT